jgi:hypothetical protein
VWVAEQWHGGSTTCFSSLIGYLIIQSKLCTPRQHSDNLRFSSNWPDR